MDITFIDVYIKTPTYSGANMQISETLSHGLHFNIHMILNVVPFLISLILHSAIYYQLVCYGSTSVVVFQVP